MTKTNFRRPSFAGQDGRKQRYPLSLFLVRSLWASPDRDPTVLPLWVHEDSSVPRQAARLLKISAGWNSRSGHQVLVKLQVSCGLASISLRSRACLGPTRSKAPRSAQQRPECKGEGLTHQLKRPESSEGP